VLEHGDDADDVGEFGQACAVAGGEDLPVLPVGGWVGRAANWVSACPTISQPSGARYVQSLLPSVSESPKNSDRSEFVLM
jgi:hypothetical protein